MKWEMTWVDLHILSVLSKGEINENNNRIQPKEQGR